MCHDVSETLLSNLLQSQLQGVVTTGLHEGRGPHQCLADCVVCEMTDDVSGQVGLEQWKAELGTDLEQAEWGIVVQRNLQNRERQALCLIRPKWFLNHVRGHVEPT